MMFKELVLKKFEFDKGSSMFQPISWMNLKTRALSKFVLRFSIILLKSNHMIFLMPFGFTRTYLFQIALEIM